MGWFRVASNRLAYRGRLTRQPFETWAKTDEGLACIEERVRHDRLRVFPRARARRRMWREIDAAARRESFCEAMQLEADRFAKTIVDVSHAPGLPRRTIALHRLVLVPRTLIAGRMRTALRQRLFRGDTLAAFDPRLREFFCEQLVVELDAAIADARPSVSRPFPAQDEWGCVGHHTEYEWVDQIFSGPGWGGHLVMFEFPRQGLARRARKDLDQAVQEIQSSLANISRNQRHAIVQTAADAFPRATA